MSQTFKPKTDISFNLFINELSNSTPLWSSIDEGLTSPTDSDFMQVDPLAASFGDNIIISSYLNCGTNNPNFNQFRLSGMQAKLRIDTGGVDVYVSMQFFDKDFIHIIGFVQLVVNASGFQDFILDMTLNLEDSDDWNLDEAILHISVGNNTTSTTPTQLINTKISVFEIEILTFTDCIIERFPQADGEFFTPTTWENELSVNHLLWESVATSGDAEFVKALDTNASGDILFEFQGVGKIPESGLFRFRARNNGVDDSALDDISLYDNLTHSIVGSGHLAHFELSGDYHTYEVPLTFLQADFLPSSLYTVGTEISATGELGIADTEISTQQLTLFMPNSYCCLSNVKETVTIFSSLTNFTNITLPSFKSTTENWSVCTDTIASCAKDPTGSHFKSINHSELHESFSHPNDTKFLKPDPVVLGLGAKNQLYIEFEPFVNRPDDVQVHLRLKFSSLLPPNLPDFTNTSIILSITSCTFDSLSGGSLISTTVTGLSFVNDEWTDIIVTVDLTSLTDAQYDDLNNCPILIFNSDTPFSGNNNTYPFVSEIFITYEIQKFLRKCTQFSYPISDNEQLTGGIWEDNQGNIFANKWTTVDEGVSTFQDGNYITYPTQIGQTDFPRISFGVDQITIDPTSMKLNFRGGGIEPSGFVAHTMTFAALYDTNGLMVANNGSTPIASLSGDMRNYTVDMNIVQANRDSWNLNRPQLELKFFVGTDVKDLRFSAVEIESCGICPPRDTGNLTLVLENLGDCVPENIMRPNTDVAILPSGEWALCSESVAWPCVDQDVNDVTDLTKIKLRELSNNRPTAIYWTEMGLGGANKHTVPQTSGMLVRQSNMDGSNIIDILDSTEIESPDNLVVDWVHDYLYFTESGNTVMQRCELDGSNLTPICDLTDLTVEDTFIDFDEKRLYFTTANSGTIEYLNLPSGGFPQNWATGFNHPTGLWKYQGDMYVVDAADGTLYQTTGGASKTLIVNGLGTASGIVGDACEGVVFVSDWEVNGTIKRISLVNPNPQTIATGTNIHSLDLDARNGLLYYTEYGVGLGSLRRVQVDGDGAVVLIEGLNIPRKINLDTAAEETHTSTLQFGLTDLSRCCLGPTSGYVSIKGAELSQPTTIESFAYIKAKIINASGDTLWQARDEPGRIDSNNGAIQIETIGFSNQATNNDFANRTEWSNAILELNIEQFLRPIQPTGFGCPQLDAGFDLYAAQFNVTACSGIENNDNITLFIDGSGDLSNVITLYTRSGFLDNESTNPVPLVILNEALPTSGDMNLFVEGFGGPINNIIPLFLETLLSESGNTDLFIRSSIEHSGFMNLFLEGGGFGVRDSSINLVVRQNDITPIAKMDMFITAPVTFTDNMKLFTTAAIINSGDMNLFTSASDGTDTVDLFLENKAINDTMNLVIIADGNFINDNIKLMVHGATISGQFTDTTLFTKVDLAFGDSTNLFVAGPAFVEMTSNMNLVIIGKKPVGTTSLFVENNNVLISDNTTLFMDSPSSISISGNMNLFMARDVDSIAGFGPTLFLKTTTPDSGGPTIFIEGGQDIIDNVTLFTKAPTPSNDDQELYIHGY